MEPKGGAVGHVMMILGAEKQGHRSRVVPNSPLLDAPVLHGDAAAIVFVGKRRIIEIDPPVGSVVVLEGGESCGGVP